MTQPLSAALPCSFNLWDAPWIRATDAHGASVEVGIGTCLTTAHTLYALHDPSPLVVGGVHRLLVAVLQAIYTPQSLDELQQLLQAGSFDPQQLDAFATQYRERFDLFHPTTPFFQTGDVPLTPLPASGTTKSVAALFSEVPSATNRTHFHHVTDDSHHVCPACCARGLITLSAFASSGGSGNFPSINGVPPVYVLPAAQSLFHTLTLSLTTPGYQPQGADGNRATTAIWTNNAPIRRNQEVHAVGYLESLTFPARRVRLFPTAASARCTHCGTTTPLTVTTILFEMGHRRPKTAPLWDDPFVAFTLPRSRPQANQAAPVPVRPQPGKALWREYSTLLLSNPDNPEQQPKVVRQIGALIDRNVLDTTAIVRFRCIGLRTDGKAKILEWLDESLEAPSHLLIAADEAGVVADALQRADATERLLRGVFDRHFRPEREHHTPIKQDLVRFKTLRQRMQTTYWERLAPAFRAFIRQFRQPVDDFAVAQAWVSTLVTVGEQVFRATTESLGTGADALRVQVTAQADCRRELHRKRKEWIGDD